MKIWDKSKEKAEELALDVQMEIMRDGVITPREARLRRRVREVAAYAAATATYVRVGQRIAGGGALDHNLLAELNEANKILRSIAIPAQGGSGSHGGKGNGLTYTRKANGSTRLVRRG